MPDSREPATPDQEVDELPRLHRGRENPWAMIAEGDSIIDGNGIVHVVEWVAGDAFDFTITCTAKLFFVSTVYFKPTAEKPNCIACLAERFR